MDKKYLLAMARDSAKFVPQVRQHLSMRTRYAVAVPAWKTTDYFLATLTRAVRDVYNGLIGGDFVDILGSLIKGQVRQAYNKAWTDDGGDPPMPAWLQDAMEAAQESQANFDFIYNFYKDIIDARVDGTPIDPLLARVPGWANQYDAEYRAAKLLIDTENGGNLMWKKGETEHGCSTCAALDGLVLSATEWETLDVHPRGYPNKKLECEGGGPVNNCDCTLEPTDQRRSPRGFDSVMNIVSK